MKIWLQINSLLLEAGEIYFLDQVCSQMFEEISLIVLLLLLLDIQCLRWKSCFGFFKGFIICDFYSVFELKPCKRPHRGREVFEGTVR